MTTPDQPPPPEPPAAVTFGGICPIFRVAALDAAVAYYVERLGFAVDWEHEGTIASVSRGPVSLFLATGDQGTPVAWAWVGVSDAEALHAELVGRGATIRQGPTNFAWALELQVEDPDGNVLRFGSSPKADVPYGPWKDGAGTLWYAVGDGWTKQEGSAHASADASPAELAPTPEERARQLRQAAESAFKEGETARARTLYEAAARATEAVGDRVGLATSAAWAARLAWRAHNDLTRAREWLVVARRASDATNDPAVWKLVREVGLELGG